VWAPSPAPSHHPTVLLVFVLDVAGCVLAEGHGALIAQLVPLETLGLKVAG
jgi:hypothetical protein